MKHLLLFALIIPTFVLAQCPFGGSQYPSGTVAGPTTIGQTVTVSTCNYAGEHSVVSNFSPQYNYSIGFSDLPVAYVTIYDMSNQTVASGVTPFTFNPPSAGSFKIRWTLNGPPTCGTDNTCHTTQVTLSGFASICTNPANGGSAQSSPAQACPSQDFTLSISGASTGSGLSYQWESSPDNVTYSIIAGATDATYTTQQTAATYYRCQVTCSAGTPAASNEVFVDMNPVSNCYCTSSANFTGDTELLKVELGPMSNTSVCGSTGGPGSIINRYSDYRSTVPAPSLERGVTYNLELSIGTCGGNYNSMSKVFIDWNNNGLFTDAGEEVFVSPNFNNGPHTLNSTISVPLGAVLGITGMRVVNMETTSAANITPCGTYGYGETEDYVVEIFPVPTCPQPTSFTLLTSNTTDADFSWTAGGSETEWELQYGPVGFTLGTGTSEFPTTNPSHTINNLSPNSFYDIYIRAICGPGDTSLWAPVLSFNTYGQGQYFEYDNTCSSIGFENIVGSDSSFVLNPDGEFGMTLPFTILYQGELVDQITVGNNGAIILGDANAQISPANGSFTGNTPDGLYPLWDDMSDGSGTINIDTRGVSPYRRLVVQWNKKHDLHSGGDEFVYQVVIEETTNEIYFQYQNTIVGNPNYDNGGSATVGATGPNQDHEISFNSSSYLSENACTHFYYTNCPNITNLTMQYLFSDEVAYTWDNGALTTNDFTVVYGPTGFDPNNPPFPPLNTTSTFIQIAGLTQNTTYDVYVYSNCSSTLQSNGVMQTFTTIPYCGNPFDINVETEIDSVLTEWDWVATDPTYALSGFELLYAHPGFDTSSTGTLLVNSTDFFNEHEDQTLLPGGAYQMYVRAVCGQYKSTYIGPIDFHMPITNDSTCLALNLEVDGTVYYFNNEEATTQVNEHTFAPPVTGSSTTDGWAENTLSKTTWFTFTAPASGSIRVSAEDYPFDGQAAVYEVGLCNAMSANSFQLLGANDDAINGSGTSPEFTVCDLTPGNTYYLMHDSRSLTEFGIYSLRLDEIVLDAGSSNGPIDICMDDTVQLFSRITTNDSSGVWNDDDNSFRIVQDTLFIADNLVPGNYDFTYVVSDGCASDDETISVEVYPPSKAGNDGGFSICLNEPFDLFEGLSGTVDLGGTWNDPNMSPLNSGFVGLGTLSVPGNYGYRYIVGNGVCVNDTSVVTVVVNNSCDYLTIQETAWSNIQAYPVPTSDIVQIDLGKFNDKTDWSLLDMNGKTLQIGASKTGDDKLSIDLSTYENGVYLVQLNQGGRHLTIKVTKE